MRIGLTADNHLDNRAGLRRDAAGVNLRTRDHERAFEAVIDGFIDAKVDLAVFGGDIFDTNRPPERCRQLFVRGIHRLAAAGIGADILEGNHEVAMRFSDSTPLTTLGLAMPSGTNVVSDYSPRVIEHPGVAITMIPWMRSDGDFLAAVSAVRPQPGVYNLLVLHCGFADLAAFAIHREGSQTLTRPLLPEGFDWIFSGHFHGHRVFADVRFTFIGSSERTSASEVGQDKGFLIHDTETGLTEFRAVPTRSWYDLGLIDATGWSSSRVMDGLRGLRDELPDWSEAIVKAKLVNIPPDSYAALPADELALIKGSAFLSDIATRRAEPAARQASQSAEGERLIGNLNDEWAAFVTAAMSERPTTEMERILLIGRAAFVGERGWPAAPLAGASPVFDEAEPAAA